MDNVIESDETYRQLLKRIGGEQKKAEAVFSPTPKRIPEAEKTEELTWLEKKHQGLIHFFESPSHLELYHFARYLLQKNVFYQIFRIHVKQTPVIDFLTGTTRISNLLETAEQVAHYLKKFTPFLEQIFSEVPFEPETLASTSISLKKFLEQLTDLKNISSILENDLHNFANNKGLPEKELYLIFKTLCKTFHLFLAKTHPQQWRLITPASEHVPKDVLSTHVLPLLTLPELNVAARVNHLWRRIAHVEIRDRLREKPNLSFWAISAHQPVAVLEECLQSDLKHQLDINRETIKGMALLHLACKRGRIGAVKSVVRSGANVSSISSGGWTPLHYACANGHLDVTQYLVDETDAKKDLTTPASSGMTPFYLACLSGQVEMVKYLLEKRAHIENYSLPNLDQIRQSGHFELEAYLTNYLSNLFMSVEKILEAYLIECKDKDRTFFAAVSFLSFLRSPSYDALANLHKFKEPLLANSSLKRLYEDCDPFLCTLIATPNLNCSSNLTLPKLIQ